MNFFASGRDNKGSAEPAWRIGEKYFLGGIKLPLALSFGPDGEAVRSKNGSFTS